MVTEEERERESFTVLVSYFHFVSYLSSPFSPSSHHCDSYFSTSFFSSSAFFPSFSFLSFIFTVSSPKVSPNQRHTLSQSKDAPSLLLLRLTLFFLSSLLHSTHSSLPHLFYIIFFPSPSHLSPRLHPHLDSLPH